MFHFLDFNNLTDGERGDIERILYHPKDKAKCEFPGEASRPISPYESKCTFENLISVDGPAIGACASYSTDHHPHQQIVNTNYVQNSAANLQFNSATVPSFIHVNVAASSQNYVSQMTGGGGQQCGGQHQFLSPVTSNPMNTMIAGPGGVQYVPLQYVFANFGSVPGRTAPFYFSTGQMPPHHRYPVIYAPTSLNFQTHDISSSNAAAASAAPPMMMMATTTNDATSSTPPAPQDEQQHQQSESRGSVNSPEFNLNADVLSPPTGVVLAAINVDSNVAMFNVNSPPTAASADDVAQRSTNDVNMNDSKSTDVPTSTDVSIQNPTNQSTENDDDICRKQPNSNPDIAHCEESLVPAVDAAGSKNDDGTSSTIVVGSPTPQTGENSFISENVAAADAAPAADVESNTTTNNQQINESNNVAVDETSVVAKSWASLFKNTRAANNAIVINKFVDDDTMGGDFPSSTMANSSNSSMASVENKPQFNVTLTSVERDPLASRLKKILKSYVLTHRGPIFQLRGLNNCGNWCYVNASLQALMACPPFVHLLRQLKFMDMRTPSSTPMLDALVKFVGEFPDKYTRKSSNQELDKGTAFEPAYIHSLLSTLRDDTSFKGRQEDAEEFLGVVLNHLHEEMAACLAFGNEPAIQNGDVNSRPVANTISTDEWQQVGSGKKSAVTRTSKLSPSPIADIFSGVLRNSFQQHGQKETATLESFFTLQLSIQSNEIVSVQSALSYMCKEIMKNANISSKNPKIEGDIIRRTTFQELPIVLILHLKYFVYTDDSVKKLIKPIQYNVDLQIDRNLAPLVQASGKIDKFSRSYKLFAVVFHHGEKAEGGHYTADIFHGGHWVNMDDIKVELVDEQHVTTFQPPRVPYLLFYRRCDMFSEQRGGGN